MDKINQGYDYNSTIINNMLENRKYFGTIDADSISFDQVNIKTEKRKEKTIAKSKELKRQLEYTTAIKSAIKSREIKLRTVENGLNIKAKITTMKGFSLIDEQSIRGNKLVFPTNISSYINTKAGEAYISLDFKDLYCAIITEILGDDLIPFDEVDEALESPVTSIILANDSSILYEEKLLDNEIYDSYKELGLRDSKYVIDSNTAMTYFRDEVQYDGTAKAVIEESFKKLRLALIELILKAEVKYSLYCNMNLLDSYDTVVNVKADINKDYESLIDILRKPIQARIFGRNFCFYPDITIIERRTTNGEG